MNLWKWYNKCNEASDPKCAKANKGWKVNSRVNTVKSEKNQWAAMETLEMCEKLLTEALYWYVISMKDLLCLQETLTSLFNGQWCKH